MKPRWKVLATAVPLVVLGVLLTPEERQHVAGPPPIAAPRSASTAPVDAGVPEDATDSEPPEPPVMGRYTTFYKTGLDGRSLNISKLSVELNFVVEPGEVWSFNKSLGPRTKERGYAKAPTIILGEMHESYGGGTCQVSTTTFAAALYAGLEIVERRPHSRPSSYVPKGLDAAVSYPEECWVEKPDPRICPDLKIKNPYDFPISIKGFAGHGAPKGHDAIEVMIWGEGEPPKVTTKWKSWKAVDPEKRFRRVLRKGSKGFQKQKGSQGIEGVLTVTTNGEESRFISRYKPVHEVWYVPIDWEEEKEEEYPE